MSSQTLKTAAERLLQKLGNGAVVLGSVPRWQVSLVAALVQMSTKKDYKQENLSERLLKFAAVAAVDDQTSLKLVDAIRVSYQKL